MSPYKLWALFSFNLSNCDQWDLSLMWRDDSKMQIFPPFPVLAAWLASRLTPLHKKETARQLLYAMRLCAPTWQWAKCKIASRVKAPREERKSGSKTEVIKIKKKVWWDVKVFMVIFRWAKGQCGAGGHGGGYIGGAGDENDEGQRRTAEFVRNSGWKQSQQPDRKPERKSIM